MYSYTRKLAPILATDVVGYSRPMGEDEEATLRTLNAFREVIDELIADHRGRIFGSAGDNVVAEFASPVEATRCAVAVQRSVEEPNADVPEDRRLRFRIGIRRHLWRLHQHGAAAIMAAWRDGTL